MSAIHGRLLTAWATAGVLGPVLVNYIRQAQIDAGVAPAQAYTITMYIMAGLLVVGFFCNLALKKVDAKYHLAEENTTTETPKKQATVKLAAEMA